MSQSARRGRKFGNQRKNYRKILKKSGQSANGEWRKQEYVLETDANYPSKDLFYGLG